MHAIAELALIGVISAAAAGGTYLVKGPPARTVVCDPATLKPGEICLAQVVEPVVWIDARPRKDWEKNGLPGSILWNLDASEDAQAFEADALVKILENPKVVVYCSNEDCGVSKQVADRVRALDPSFDVKSLRGGWQALSDAGRIKASSEAP